MWQHLELASELESDLWPLQTVAGKNLLISMLEKLVLLDWSKNTGSTDVKMDGSVLEDFLF